MNPMTALKKMRDYALMVVDDELEMSGLIRVRTVVKVLELLLAIDEQAFWDLWGAIEERDHEFGDNFWIIERLLHEKVNWWTEEKKWELFEQLRKEYEVKPGIEFSEEELSKFCFPGRKQPTRKAIEKSPEDEEWERQLIENWDDWFGAKEEDVN
jgi:hypothetical protein